MKKLILMSHGNVAEGFLKSLDMIAGGHSKVSALTFDGIISKEQLGCELQELVGDDEAIIVVDLPGGTPCNVALEKYLDNQRITILASLNLPMLLELYLNLDNSNYQIPQAVKAGQDNIFNIKDNMNQNNEDDE